MAEQESQQGQQQERLVYIESNGRMSGNQGTQGDVEQQEQLREQVDVPEQVQKQQESQQKQQASQRSAVGAKRTAERSHSQSGTSTVKWGASSFRQ